MSRAVIALGALLAGCNTVFGIAETVTFSDAAPAVDSDGDGVFDRDDNCPAAPNDQNDEDEDGVGDVCDNCPLVANPLQEQDGDDDPVGDACDPRPTIAGDCLVLFDAFASPAAFATHWQVYTASGAGPVAVTPQPGHVTLDTSDVNPVTIVALDASGVPLTGLFDVQVAARAQLISSSGGFGAVSRANDYQTGYACGVANFQDGVTVVVGSFGSSANDTVRNALSTEPTPGTSVVRLFSPRPEEPFIGCRAELGAAAGVGALVLKDTSPRPPAVGSPGVRAVLDAVDVLAIAIYRFDGATCAAPTYR